MCPDGACKLTCEEYWNAGCIRDRMGSCPTTPRPLTVSKVPDSENILQLRSLNWTAISPKFSSRIQYRHCTKTKKTINNKVTVELHKRSPPVGTRASASAPKSPNKR